MPEKLINSRTVVVLFGLVLFAATVFAYQQVWRAGYIWDDDLYVTENPLITMPDGFWRIWFSLDSPSQYFPLVYSAFRVQHALWGFDPAGYHWVNIVLHAVNGLVLWQLLRRLQIPGAWLAAALFALHPVQVESVAWITELKNVLMGFFFLLTIICWLRFLEENRRNRAAFYAAALVCYALALFSKTTACTLPAALVLILWLRRTPLTLRRWLEIAPFVALAAAMGAVTIWWERYHQGTQGAAFAVGFGERILIASRAVWFYLSKLAWPNELIFSYPRWAISLNNPSDYLWLGLLILGAIAVWVARRYTGRAVEVALAFFVATLLPVLGFIMLWTFRYSWVADHYQYLACIGPLALFAAGLELTARRFGRTGRWLLLGISAVILLSLGMRTWRQGAIYNDAETLWRATIRSNPANALAHDSLGVILGSRNAPIEEEMAEYEKAIASDPHDAEAHNNLGFSLQRLGRTEEALAEYEQSVAADPRYAIAHGNLANLLLQRGRAEDAIQHLERVLAIMPQNAALDQSLGDILARAQRTSDALEHWKRALALAPNDAALQAKVGHAVAGAGQIDAALPYLRAAAELAPGDAQAQFDYAAALALLGRFGEAIPPYREATRLQPGMAEAHANLAICYLQTDQVNEALAEFQRTAELRPDDAAVHKNLALVLRHLGRNAEADAHEQRALELGTRAPR